MAIWRSEWSALCCMPMEGSQAFLSISYHGSFSGRGSPKKGVDRMQQLYIRQTRGHYHSLHEFMSTLPSHREMPDLALVTCRFVIAAAFGFPGRVPPWHVLEGCLLHPCAQEHPTTDGSYVQGPGGDPSLVNFSTFRKPMLYNCATISPHSQISISIVYKSPP